MTYSEDLKKSIKNVVNMVDNSILILRDLDRLLSEYGYSPTHGNELATEQSHSINQTSKWKGYFYPQYMARYYSTAKSLENERMVIGVNVQFFHSDVADLHPSLSVAVIQCATTFGKKRPDSWWVKHLVYEHPDSSPVDLTGQGYRLSFLVDEKTCSAYVFSFALLGIKDFNELQDKIVPRVVSEIASIRA